jgi:hypothetical protein
MAGVCPHPGLILLLTISWLMSHTQDSIAVSESTRALPVPEPSSAQIIKPSDWKGGIEANEGECGMDAGEYAYWVYATATQCGVPREQADRVVLVRQPTLGVAPLTAVSSLPGGRYLVWVYGAGQPGHPWLSFCAKFCVKGELPPTPAWVALGWVEIRENQRLYLRSWQQPEGHRLYIQAMVLSSNETRPDWVP